MRSSITEPWHMLGVAAFISVAIVAVVVAPGVRYRLLGCSLAAVSIAELMKSALLVSIITNHGMHLVWRGVVQWLCLIAFCLLTESVSASVWGVLWSSRWFKVRLTLVSLVACFGLVVIPGTVPQRIARIEDKGGWQPVVSLSSFSIPLMFLAVLCLYFVWKNRKQVQKPVFAMAAVVTGFSIDSGSLLIKYILSGPGEGRSDNGVLWITCIPAAVVVGVACIGWQRQRDSRSDDQVLLNLWLWLYSRWGEGNPWDVLEARKCGGQEYTWVVLLRESTDFIKAHSDCVSKLFTDAKLSDVNSVRDLVYLGAQLRGIYRRKHSRNNVT